jgi:putative Mg2+ transporter-C (MgtC) family protein
MTTTDVLLRIGLAFLAGMMLGLERETHGRAAGLRTTTLACVASCLAMILAQLFLHDAAFKNQAWRPDPGRLAAGVLTGIGFLGAGAIVREGVTVRGVTTAAVLWYITILGLVFGTGHIFLGLIGWVIALICLVILPHLERRMHRDSYATVAVTIQLGGVADAEIRECFKGAKLTIERVSLDYDLQQRQRKFSYALKCDRGNPLDMAQKLVEKLTDLPGVTRVEWK